MKTHIICIVDKSGSMSGLQNDVIGSFNRFIDEQRELSTEANKAKVTLNLFNESSNFIYLKSDITEVVGLDKGTYVPRGGTALYDAIGHTINKLINKKRAIVLIHTDGEENSSKVYNKELIKQLVKQKTEEGWKFIFFGANIDASSVGNALNIHDTFQVEYSATGITKSYDNMSSLTRTHRGL